MTARLQPETHAALLRALVDIGQLLRSATDPVVADQLDRARHDLRQGWREAAHDALERARRLLAGKVPSV